MDITRFTGKIGLVLILRGTLEIKINGKNYHFLPKQAFIVSPLFIFENAAESQDFECEIMLEDFMLFFTLIKNLYNSYFPKFIINHPYTTLTDDQISYVLSQIRIAKTQKMVAQDETLHESLRNIYNVAYGVTIQATVIALLSQFFHQNKEEIFNDRKKTEKSMQIITNFLLAINQNYRKERSVSYYAQMANLSVGHFSSLVRKKTGHSPMHWITFITINNAKVLLSNSQKSIKEIAQELGFPEQYTFRKYFKLNTGISPKEWRKAQ